MTTAVCPGLFYKDADAAIAWLQTAFGFDVIMHVPGPDDTVAHAQLRLGDAIVMLESAKREPKWSSPRDLGGASGWIHIPVDDVDAHHAQAVASGAKIEFPLRDTDYGSREYTASDPEGQLWSFGTYRPG